MPSFSTPKYFVAPPIASHKIVQYFWTKTTLKIRTRDETVTYIADDADKRIIDEITELLTPAVLEFEKLSDDKKIHVWYDELIRIEEEERQERIAEKHWKWMNPHI